MFKWTRRMIVGAVLGTLAVVGVGYVCLGTNLLSYAKSSGKMFQSAVKDSIPIEFEIQRARDLLEDLIPEMRANLRIVAAEEVEVANLEKEIQRQGESLESERGKVAALRDTLRSQQVSYDINGRTYGRSELVDELGRRFEQLRTAESLHSGKKDLLKNRRKSLDAAVQKLEKTRVARIELASQIEALEGQFRLIQAQAAGSEFQIDDTKLAQTQRVISELKKRLEVSQRVLAQEARFVDGIPLEPAASESSVVERVDTYFSQKDSRPAPAAARTERVD